MSLNFTKLQQCTKSKSIDARGVCALQSSSLCLFLFFFLFLFHHDMHQCHLTWFPINSGTQRLSRVGYFQTEATAVNGCLTHNCIYICMYVYCNPSPLAMRQGQCSKAQLPLYCRTIGGKICHQCSKGHHILYATQDKKISFSPARAGDKIGENFLWFLHGCSFFFIGKIIITTLLLLLQLIMNHGGGKSYWQHDLLQTTVIMSGANIARLWKMILAGMLQHLDILEHDGWLTSMSQSVEPVEVVHISMPTQIMTL